MQSDKLTDKGNQNNGVGLIIDCDGGAEYTDNISVGDFTSFRQLPLPVNPFPDKDADVSYLGNRQEVSASRIVGLPDNMKLEGQQVPQDITSGTAWNLNPGTNAFPQQMVRGTHQQISTHDSASSFMNAGVSACRFPNPQASRNTMLMSGSAEAGYQMNSQFGDSNSHTIARPQSDKRYPSLKSRYLSRHSIRNPQLKAETDAKAIMGESGSLKKMDGRFLSLGHETNINGRSSRYISTREISSILEDPSLIFSTTNDRHATRSSSSLVQKPDVGFPNSQESGTGISKPALYMGGLSNRNEANEFCISSAELNSRPFHILQTPEINIQQNMLSVPNNRISNSESNRDLTPSAANGSNSTAFPLSGQNRVPSLTSRSDNYTGTGTGRTPFQLHRTESAQKHLLNSIFYPHILRNGERGVKHGHSGFSFAHESTLDAAAAARNLLPDNNQFQTNDSTPAVVASGVFPKRLGVQNYNAQVPEGSSIPIDWGVQAASKYCKFHNNVPVRLCRDLHVSSAYGQSPGVPVLPPANYRGPVTADALPQRSALIQNWRPMSTTGQGVAKVNEDPQNNEVLNRPYLKRGAIQSPQDAIWVHRKKLAHNPIVAPPMPYRPIHPSLPYEPIPPSVSCKEVPPASFKSKNAPALLPTETTAHPSMLALPHIRWKGTDEQPEPTGDKCLICKRDLIYSPEGPVERPPIFPPVAVLPCGHTFHDHCLQKITPKDQSKSPPCIPCAIGEN